MGILYNDGEGSQDSESNMTSSEFPPERPSMFVIRRGRRSRRRPAMPSLPLYLSYSDLSDDADIAAFFSPVPHTSVMQYCEYIATPNQIETPLSLPPTPALESLGGSTHFLDNNAISYPFLAVDGDAGDWTFIGTPHPLRISSPPSEPETWILCDDL
jgi:hypothetical protein